MTPIELHFQFLELLVVCIRQTYEINFPPSNQSPIFLWCISIGWLRHQLLHYIMRQKLFEHKQADNYDTIHTAKAY